MSEMSLEEEEEGRMANGGNKACSHLRDELFKLFPDPGVSVLKMMASEFIGTFIMVFAAVSTSVVDVKYPNSETLISKAAAAGIAVMLIVLTIGHISGTHLNPSVTIALSIFRHFPFIYAPLYIAAQICGSICASFVLKFIFHSFKTGVTVPTIDTGRAFFLEFVITFILLFVIISMAFDSKTNKKSAGMAIGMTILLNALIAGPSTGASMNPARTLGPAIATGNYERIWIYMLAPIFGAIAGTGFYDFLFL